MAKVTKRDMFIEIATVLEDAGYTDLAEVMDHEIELIDKRKGAERKPTANQLENEEIKDAIEGFLNGVEGATATEIATAVGFTVQRVAQLLKQMGAESRVAKTEAHGKEKARFALA